MATVPEAFIPNKTNKNTISILQYSTIMCVNNFKNESYVHLYFSPPTYVTKKMLCRIFASVLL